MISTQPQTLAAAGPVPSIAQGNRCHHSPGWQPKLAFGNQHVLMWLTRSQTSIQPLVVAGGRDINSEGSRVTDGDTACGSIPGLNDTMAPCDSTDHSDQHSLGSSKALGHKQPQVVAKTSGIRVAIGGNLGHRHQHRSQAVVVL